MFFLIGFIVVAGSVVGGYLGSGGHLGVLWQPFEFVIIFGCAIGAFVVANPKQILTGTAKSFGKLIKGSAKPDTDTDYPWSGARSDRRRQRALADHQGVPGRRYQWYRLGYSGSAGLLPLV